MAKVRGLSVSKIAESAGVKLNSVHRILRSGTNARAEKVRRSVISHAFNSDLELEAITTAFDGCDVKVTTQLIASVIIYELEPCELAELKKVEELVGMKPLPPAVIRSTVERLRRNRKPQE